ncbi:hypothetical protein F4776DRAFT_673420 [Hypoxylon sp. NC0597]|nr:hypothetical protein F4776DRAFT_673420 [Hypoxylon sp. NC0597]
MEAQRVEQPAQAADRNMAAPVHDPGHLLAINQLNTNATRVTLASSHHLVQAYWQTRDEAFLDRRTLILHQSLAYFDAMIEHATECQNTIQAALEPQNPQAANVDPDPHPHPRTPVDQYIPIPQEPLVAQDAPIDRAMPPLAEVPVHQGAPVDLAMPGLPEVPIGQGVPINPTIPAGLHKKKRDREHKGKASVKDKLPSSPGPYGVDSQISHSWTSGMKLSFSLRYAGPPGLDPPSVFLGRRATGRSSTRGWYAEGWTPRRGGDRVKTYVILATWRNLAIIRQAYGRLTAYKSDLENPRYVPKNIFDDGPLDLLVIPARTNRLLLTTGTLLLRDTSREGKEETRSAATGVKVELEYLGRDDLIFWVEEETLRIFYDLHRDLENEVNTKHQLNPELHR